MRILILGSTGMLGNAVAKHFQGTEHEIRLTHRDPSLKLEQGSEYFDALDPDFSIVTGCDYVLNCIGTIKPFMNRSMTDSIWINSLFPRMLADYCEKSGVRLIHITTDCVFSGKDGDYVESSLHDCLDEYGKSKSLGEPKNCMVIRTSIIGEEIHNNASLIAWCKSRKDKEVNGFTNHYWNGVTTNHYAELVQQIMEENLYEHGLFHVFSNVVTKHELLEMINEKFQLNMTIREHCDKIETIRTLYSDKHLIDVLNIKTLSQQIKEL